jgi:hypothetical protein
MCWARPPLSPRDGIHIPLNRCRLNTGSGLRASPSMTIKSSRPKDRFLIRGKGGLTVHTPVPSPIRTSLPLSVAYQVTRVIAPWGGMTVPAVEHIKLF